MSDYLDTRAFSPETKSWTNKAVWPSENNNHSPEQEGWGDPARSGGPESMDD